MQLYGILSHLFSETLLQMVFYQGGLLGMCVEDQLVQTWSLARKYANNARLSDLGLSSLSAFIKATKELATGTCAGCLASTSLPNINPPNGSCFGNCLSHLSPFES